MSKEREEPVPDIDGLVRRAQAGEREAFSNIYEHFFGGVFKYVSFRVRNYSVAEDLVQETFVRAFQSLSSFQPRGYPFSSWLFRIAHNLVVDHFRQNSKATLSWDEVALTSSEREPDEVAEAKLEAEELLAAMSRLTDAQRRVLELRFGGGLSLEETAKVMGKKANAIKALQHSAVQALRRIMPSREPQR